MTPTKDESDGQGSEEIEQGDPQTQGGQAQEERLQPVDEGADKGRQPLIGRRAPTPLLLGALFAFAAATCALAGASLPTPGGPLDWIWRVKPDEHART